MNPSQLWETTHDPNARTLLKAEISETDEADSIFTALIGDFAEVVSPKSGFMVQLVELYGLI